MKGLFARIAARNYGGELRSRADGIAPTPIALFSTPDNSAETPGVDVAAASAESGLDKQNSNLETIRGRICSEVAASAQSNVSAIERPAHVAEQIDRKAHKRALVEPVTPVSSGPQAVQAEPAAKLEPHLPHCFTETTASSTSRPAKRPEADPGVSIQAAILPEQPLAPVQPQVATSVDHEMRHEASQRIEKSPPAVHVTIGVVEVRANAVAASPPLRSMPAPGKSEPALSIDTYLADRQAGRR